MMEIASLFQAKTAKKSALDMLMYEKQRILWQKSISEKHKTVLKVKTLKSLLILQQRKLFFDKIKQKVTGKLFNFWKRKMHTEFLLKKQQFSKAIALIPKSALIEKQEILISKAKNRTKSIVFHCWNHEIQINRAILSASDTVNS